MISVNFSQYSQLIKEFSVSQYIYNKTEENFKLSAHEGEEFIYVMSGEVEIDYGKEKYSLKEGDSIFYDSIVEHHVHGAIGKSARILAVVYIPF